MLIGIFGESCVGKSTLAAALQEKLAAEVYTGKDYLRLAKSEPMARTAFQKRLRDAVDDGAVIYVISDREDLALLPEGTIRILVTADLQVIQARFAARLGGTLPRPVAAMLERKHGSFDHESRDIHVESGETDFSEVWAAVQEKARK